ncbi:MAG: indole-3-glycerol phosphate synthase TrpC [Chloroflexi bacterium]|nr:indole-3-glycerol phosphate synthase TrpC [Chloroflexota bacterium]
MATYLDDIVARRRKDVEARKATVPLADLTSRIDALPPTLDLAKALTAPGLQVIAEFKRASPSKGDFALDADPVAVARAYARAQAAAISVLTEEPHFRGSVDHLTAIKTGLGSACPPLLRKDFIIDPYQVYEARAYRADALLLIVASLTDSALAELMALAGSLGLACLVEVHTKDEAHRAVAAGASIIGINNRNLHSFATDLNTTRIVRPSIPDGCIVVSESGIKTAEEVAMLASWGIDAILIGEALMTAVDPGAALAGLMRRD